MAGLLFSILTFLAILIVIILNKRSHFFSDFCRLCFFIAIPAAGIYCALEHKEVGMRISLGIVAVAIAGYLFLFLGMGFARLWERLLFSVKYYTLEKISCVVFTIGGIGLAVWGFILLPTNWLTVVSYVVFVPLLLIAFFCSQYQYKN